MRKLLIFLSIGFIFTLIQCSNGAPMKSISSESEEDDSVAQKGTINLKVASDSDDQSDESTTKANSFEVQANESELSDAQKEAVPEVPVVSSNSEDSNDRSDEQSNVGSIVNGDYRRILLDTDD